jgi:uncharacterized membrane protein YfcA
MLIGIFLIIFGGLMLLNQLGWIDIRMGQYILPVLLIALGASMVAGHRRRQEKHKETAGPPK